MGEDKAPVTPVSDKIKTVRIFSMKLQGCPTPGSVRIHLWYLVCN